MGAADALLREQFQKLPDEDARKLHAKMRRIRDGMIWEQLVRSFPQINTDKWRKVAPGQYIPPDPAPIETWRKEAIATVERLGLDPAAILAWYANGRCIEFINHWGITYDPRSALRKGATTHPPLLLFRRQRDMVRFLLSLLRQEEHALFEKSRDMGATWVCCLFSVWLWLTTPAAIGWGSRKEELVDRIGDPDSIFEKLRMAIRALPPFLIPPGLNPDDHLVFMKCINPATGATITGECGDNIGRGGRKLIYFKDESAHYARPELIEAALGNNTNVQVDFSSVNGLGNVFHRRREAGEIWIPGKKLVSGRANVFILDWHDHPGKDQEWYDTARAKAEREGLLHKFKQENDRDYAAGLAGIIIQPEWIESAVDAHIHLGLTDATGPWSSGLDVGDGLEGDGNGQAAFEGIILRMADKWADRDVGVTTRKAIDNLEGITCDLQYDCIGVGAGVKAEANRLADAGELPMTLKLVPWNAAASPLYPDDPVVPDDRDSPTNRAMFANLKAQGWWNLARRFEKTHRARTEGIVFPTHELVSIDSRIPQLAQVKKELAQPTHKRRVGDGKIVVDKTPEGTHSPNMGDAIVMAANPAEALAPVYATATEQFMVEPFTPPLHWPRSFAMKVEPGRVCALWGAYDKDQKTLYIISEHSMTGQPPAANAAAILARGDWIPGLIECEETNIKAREDVAEAWRAYKLKVLQADKSFDAGIEDATALVTTGRLKVSAMCQGFLREYRSFRRNEKGEVINSGLMDCLRLLCRPASINYMIVKPRNPIIRPGHVGDVKMGY